MLHGCKVVTRVQITNTTRTLSKFRLSRCTLLTSNNVFSRAMWYNNPLKIFQRLQMALAIRARGILSSLKKLLVFIKTKLHVVTYTNIKILFAQCDYFQIIYNTQPERPETLKPSRWKIVSLNLINERRGKMKYNCFPTRRGKYAHTWRNFCSFLRSFIQTWLNKRSKSVVAQFQLTIIISSGIHSTLPNFFICLLLCLGKLFVPR